MRKLSAWARRWSLLVTMLIPGIAVATPPNLEDVAYMPLCARGDRIALFAMAKTNLGSYFVDSTRFALLLVDTATGKYEIGRLGGLDLEGEDKRPETDAREVVAGGKLSLVETLHAWGTDQCLWLSQSFQREPPDKRFAYKISDAGLVVMLNDREQTVKDGFTFEASAEIAEFTREGIGRPEPLSPAETLDPPATPQPGAEPEPMQLVTAEIELESRTLFLFRMENDPGAVAERDLIVVAVTAKLKRAKAWLLNAFAFEDLHRKGKWAEAAEFFELAAQLDPENPTPRYNQACAFARQQRAFPAVVALRSLTPTAALRAKILKDPDFEAVREDRKFVEFMESLPKK